MLLIAIIDWQHLIIPNETVIVGFIVGSALKAFSYNNTFVNAIISSIASMVLITIILLITNRIFKKEAIGWGDVKLAGVIGLFLGFQDFLVVLWLAAVSGSIYGIWLLRKHEMSRDAKIPFGSFLAAASCIVLYFQESILELIQSWLTYGQ
jgi:prepilin signal peptidase PulO-like enzyme (type II secretory pathway)